MRLLICVQAAAKLPSQFLLAVNPDKGLFTTVCSGFVQSTDLIGPPITYRECMFTVPVLRKINYIEEFPSVYLTLEGKQVCLSQYSYFAMIKISVWVIENR
jgi:hypothetical protein